MEQTGADPESGVLGRKVSRRGVVAGLALAPLALEVGRAGVGASAAPAEAQAAVPLASNLAQAPARIVRGTNPPLEESPLEALEGLITPTPLHFIRNHGPNAEIDVASWRLAVDGDVDRPLQLSYDDLRSLPSRSVDVLLECAGNGRGRFNPPATGTQWGQGAASVAEWTGVPLRTVLDLAGMRPNTVHVVARGGDQAAVTRGLPTEFALRPDTMLAWAMNGEVLPVAHGYPLRLVVPNWIGVASIKWLVQLTASPVPLEGQYQTVNYMVYREGEAPFPATLQPVKSVIARPTPNAALGAGPVTISGFAWSGAGTIARVEVSADGGASWSEARLLDPISPLTWARWSVVWQPPSGGSFSLMSRATDETGQVQPTGVPWNRLGYGYNAIESVPVTVAEAAPAAAAPVASAPAETQPAAAPAAPAEAPAGGDPGQQVFAANCARCHGSNGEGSPRGPQLVGPNTAPHELSADDLYNYVHTAMPLNNPGSLTDQEYRDVVTYLRKLNGLP